MGVVTHNGITPPENSDFSMNWVFYDFCNDIIIDKTGFAVQAVIANRCEIPCSRSKWDSWVSIGGSRVLFRYYKFLIRGYVYDDQEMAYIAEKLLGFWSRDPLDTILAGKEILGNLAGDVDKMSRLRQLVFISFGMVTQSPFTTASSRRSVQVRSVSMGSCRAPTNNSDSNRFLSANSWWQKGWLRFLSD